MVKKILFPTDGSENSKKAIDYAVEIAKSFSAKVLIVHSYEIPAVVYAHPSATINYYYLKGDLEKSLEDSGTAILNEIRTEFESRGVNADVLLKKGEAGFVITEEAEKEACDMIIMGTRGLGTVKSLLLGSVSNYVIHHTKCSVFLVH